MNKDENSNNGVLTKHMIFAKTRANSLTDVKVLTIWGYDITDISILQYMPNVETVSLPMNKIRNLDAFQYCHKIREISLRKNLISDFEELRYLCNLPRLEKLWLSDNPIASQKNYREQVISILPQLKVLDEIPVNYQSPSNKTARRIPKINAPPSFAEPVHMNNISSEIKTQNRSFSDDEEWPTEQQQIPSNTRFLRREPEPSPQIKNVPHQYPSQPNSDEGPLTAVLALLPYLTPESLSIVLEAIRDLSK
ncbi:Leucine Rich Repeat family protein [Histomonas meleagridis]|uniref:Leucine Rich Repeat family protein n=1 Tax=Histomonas meleagridis TaxID=135588 RepID=UPI00355A376F|nr:Leucine Rich Repeat family protein [Histomonas meleagridis]KAH0804043.1 Leucine Rich Repeat family protein [Histomonas meleagridis]